MVVHYTCYLREFRQKIGWTQEELAVLVDTTQNTISNLELCLYRPSLELAFKIGMVFDSDPYDIFVFKVIL